MSPDVLRTPIFTTSAARTPAADVMSVMQAMDVMRSIRAIMRSSPCRRPFRVRALFCAAIQKDLADVFARFHAGVSFGRLPQWQDGVDARPDVRPEQRPDPRPQRGCDHRLAFEFQRSQ